MTQATNASSNNVASRLLAYHNDPRIKAKYLSRVRRHRKLDQLIKGQYWEDGKGCAVGCTVHSADHSAYETELGIPRILARLEDGIFEALDNGHAQAWPERFLAAIRPGTDLSLVWPKFAVWLMLDLQWGVLQYAKTEASRKAIQDVGEAYQRVADGSKEVINWRKLRAAADAAADAYAAYAAAAAAADAAAAAAAYAAYAAYGNNHKEARIAQSNKLIELLEESV